MKVLIFLTALAGCSVVEHQLDPSLDQAAESLLAQDLNVQNERFLRSNQPAPYQGIILQKYTEFEQEFQGNLDELAILQVRAKQNKLPQFTPSASARANGSVSANIGVRQALFAGQLYEAEFHDANVQAISQQVTVLQALNQETSQDLKLLLDYRENVEVKAMLDRLATELEKLLDLARLRSRGGLVTADEVALFELNLTEIRTDATIAYSNAKVALADLPQVDTTAALVNFHSEPDQIPIDLLVALTERELARSELRLSHASSQPKVAIEGSGGIDLLTGKPLSRAGLVVESDPITLGGNTTLQLAELKLRLAERKLAETVSDLAQETARREMQIQALESQLGAASNLMRQASIRLDSFPNQFAAGSADLPEAIGLVDTLRRSMESQIRTKYEILNLRREIAEDLGDFWSFS